MGILHSCYGDCLTITSVRRVLGPPPCRIWWLRFTFCGHSVRTVATLEFLFPRLTRRGRIQRRKPPLCFPNEAPGL